MHWVTQPPQVHKVAKPLQGHWETELSAKGTLNNWATTGTACDNFQIQLLIQELVIYTLHDDDDEL